MIDYMETGCVGLPKYPTSMGMSNAYSMGSPSCSMESAANMSHCAMNSLNHSMRPRTSTSTTEYILKEISSSACDAIYNYASEDMRAMTGGMVNSIAPSRKAMPPAMQANPTLPHAEMTQILEFDRRTPDENQHKSCHYSKSDAIINQDVFTSRAGSAKHSEIDQTLLNNSYLQAPGVSTSDNGFMKSSSVPNFSSAATGEDLYAFPTSNMNPPSVSSSVCFSEGFEMKEEPPQIVPQCPSTSVVSPINMEHQEVIKTERKRQRNRVAASKCRKRKLERIARLEEKVNSLKNQNLELTNSANALRQQVADLKSKVISHVNSGCQLMLGQQLSYPFESQPVI